MPSPPLPSPPSPAPVPAPAPSPVPSPAPQPDAATTAALLASPTGAAPPTAQGTRSLWGDEFNGDSLDTSKWLLETERPQDVQEANQQQVYTASPDNVWVADGSLHIAALRDGQGGFTSGRLNSRLAPGGTWYPGMVLDDGATLGSVRVEARVQVPGAGQGLMASVWLSPPDYVYGPWPQSGEIDIMHCINSMDSVTQGVHYGAQYPGNVVADVQTPQPQQQLYSDAFHTFAVEWAPDSITLFVDGLETKRVVSRGLDVQQGWWTAAPSASPQAPFDIPFSLILNVAVGGNWPGPADDSTPFPAVMLVDHVRVSGTVK